MAFYPRDNQKPDHTTHTALLLVPDPKSNTKSSFRYHISTFAGDNHWQYKRDELQPASEGLSFGRTPHLAALVFIDYVSSDETEIRKIMESVPLKQCDVNWWCYHWVWDVLIRLEKAKIIRRLPEGGPEKIWQNGLQFCKQHGTSKDEVVPTCDVDGNRLLSEL
ncbi:hypothetical protein PHLCEN_2v9203 [Hermanssonia centrifuga]|uniref:Uncharacterized protein n=1 Tax=Hermanssonia centrifuga TaxID=98765 RepID=A0A2R6NRH3_9APHY|nr:hypothetical protein PHLCEN_2v9203 [Hermanssonia centrifuga]